MTSIQTKQSKVKMPGSMRQKLMAAAAMLLVAAILLVSSTYAWFTLSTAPEITGITTSVGANGNLEMALLQSDNHISGVDENTYGDMSKITSAVGDSSAATNDVLKSNITWGNLVNLQDEKYGLGRINLLPARLHSVDGKVNVTGSILSTATYGTDGRVIDVTGTTYTSGTFDSANHTWTYDANKLTYGVRAIGGNDNLTAQQAGLLAAKNQFSLKLIAAKTTVQNALSANGQNLANAVMLLAMDKSDNLEAEQTQAIDAMLEATEKSLKDIDAAYGEVLRAAAASSIADANTYSNALTALQGKSYSEVANSLPEGVTAPESLTTAAAKLAQQTQAVSEAKTKAQSANYKDALKALIDAKQVKVNGYNATASTGEDHSKDLMVNGQINSTFFSKMTADGGIIVEMPDGSGVFAYIGSVAGNYSAATRITVNYNGLKVENMPATMTTIATVDSTVSNAIKDLTAANATGNTTSLSDTYGYALDMAFRTNAAGSYLKLLTAGTQRIYQDSANADTLGKGSTMSFNANGSGLTDVALSKLMQAIRVGFINPEDGTIYGIASLDNIGKDGDSLTGELTLKSYSFLNDGNDNGKLILQQKTEGTDDEKAKLLDLPQNTAIKLTVLVWLDGDEVDNSMVANAMQSMTGSMNLQFGSSATLNPMNYTPLKNPK